MRLHLVAIRNELVVAWHSAFKTFPEVDIIEGDILSVAQNTIVSPANSYGYMDGGIDRLYTDFFGFRPQQEIQEIIARRPEGYLPVGAAVLVNTGHPGIPYMIAAPTMFLPGAIPAANCFFAMAAILKKAYECKDIVKDIFCPGLGTGIGQVNPEIAASEMAMAYAKFISANNNCIN